MESCKMLGCNWFSLTTDGLLQNNKQQLKQCNEYLLSVWIRINSTLKMTVFSRSRKLSHLGKNTFCWKTQSPGHFLGSHGEKLTQRIVCKEFWSKGHPYHLNSSGNKYICGIIGEPSPSQTVAQCLEGTLFMYSSSCPRLITPSYFCHSFFCVHFSEYKPEQCDSCTMP